ncbi:MAG: TfoX/Sxy family protein [Bacteroidetes bacterium]|nr:TfoX/Sxy family protein [Bacteroidota bacterium]
MAFNESLSDRIREALAHLEDVEEKHMFGGVCYMVNGKMCVGVVKDEMMCRIDPGLSESLFEKTGCRPMDFTGKRMKGYVFVGPEGMRNQKEFNNWIKLCLDFNASAKASKKRQKK